jgi:predicted nucleic acid-binding protein
MIAAVYDCNVLIAGLGWPGHPRLCLHLVGADEVRLCVTNDILAEYHGKVVSVLKEKRPEVDPRPLLDWLLPRVYLVSPAPLGKSRSRDVKDDIYLAAALGAGALFLVTNDRDWLVLGKPFGVVICTPIEFLKHVQSHHGLYSGKGFNNHDATIGRNRSIFQQRLGNGGWAKTPAAAPPIGAQEAMDLIHEAGASPSRHRGRTAEPTPALGKRPAAQRVLADKGGTRFRNRPMLPGGTEAEKGGQPAKDKSDA